MSHHLAQGWLINRSLGLPQEGSLKMWVPSNSCGEPENRRGRHSPTVTGDQIASARMMPRKRRNRVASLLRSPLVIPIDREEKPEGDRCTCRDVKLFPLMAGNKSFPVVISGIA